MRQVNQRAVASTLVDDLFPSRWSPRAMSGELVTDEEFAALIEAARWAPSSSNNQPWRFLAAQRDSSEWEPFFSLLNEGNQEWTHRASHLMVLLAKTTTREGKPYALNRFDTGAAWMSLALQGHLLGLAVHAMGGFKKDAAITALSIPEGFEPTVMIAIGRPGRIENLPERRRDQEGRRSQRLPPDTIVAHGAFPERWSAS